MLKVISKHIQANSLQILDFKPSDSPQPLLSKVDEIARQVFNEIKLEFQHEDMNSVFPIRGAFLGVKTLKHLWYNSHPDREPANQISSEWDQLRNLVISKTNEIWKNETEAGRRYKPVEPDIRNDPYWSKVFYPNE